jgi:protein-tyrosine phosphatase
MTYPAAAPASRRSLILFVCTGNICRSPTAEGVFRALAERAGIAGGLEIGSRGTHEYHVGEPPDQRAQAAALRRGYDLSAIRARKLSREDVVGTGLLLALDRGHEKFLRRMAPPQSGRTAVRLFLSFVPGLETADVPDPYYGGAADFERALDLIEEGAAALVEAIRAGRA